MILLGVDQNMLTCIFKWLDGAINKQCTSKLASVNLQKEAKNATLMRTHCLSQMCFITIQRSITIKGSLAEIRR